MKGASVNIALIIAADEPAIFYKSIKAAELDLEPVDVRAGVYRAAFGPDGELYDIGLKDDTVIITRALDRSNETQNLRKVLVEFLTAMKTDVDEHAGLAELLEQCERYAEG